MFDRIEDKISKNIKLASSGRDLWIRLVEDYEIKNSDYVVLFPSLNKEYNYYGLLYLEEFLKLKKADKAVILTYDDAVKESAALFSDKVKVVDFCRKQVEELMKFYSLYEFTNKLYIISLEEPEGRSSIELVGKKGITLEEIIAIGIYGIKNFVKLERPLYTGENKRIIDFLKNNG